MARLLLGDPARAAARYATVAAALSTLGYGAVDPIPRSERMAEALAHSQPELDGQESAACQGRDAAGPASIRAKKA